MGYESLFCHNYGSFIGEKVYFNVLSLDYTFFRTQSISSYISLLSSKVNVLSYQLFFPFFRIISSMTSILIILVYLLYTDFLLTSIFVIFLLVIYILISLYTKRRIGNYAVYANNVQNSIITLLRDSFGAFKEITLFNNQGFFMKAYQSFNYNYKRAQSELQIFGILPKTFIEPFFMILVASLILSDKSSASSIIITLYGFMRLLPLGQVAYYNFNTFKGAKPTFLEFLGLIETAKVLSANVLEKSDFKSINLKRVSVTYGEIKILDRLSLEIRRGDRIAVLGRSGSGKTTLVDLLIGLIKSSSGELFIDNSLTSDIQFSYRMMSVTAHVKQDVFLVTGSILDNVAFNIPFDEIDFVKFNEVIRMSGLTEFIEKLPSKELTKLGENGAMISGGQRQRIGIARALYSGRKFIVFDEATSALDEETETGIFESLCQLDSTYTILFVTHKKELTKFSTKVIEL